MYVRLGIYKHNAAKRVGDAKFLSIKSISRHMAESVMYLLGVTKLCVNNI